MITDTLPTVLLKNQTILLQILAPHHNIKAFQIVTLIIERVLK